MTKQSDYRKFTLLLQQATSMIPHNYMQLPVAGKEQPDYRERVYCYELYHCLRAIMEKEENKVFSDYMLCGETDKSGHPLIRGNDLDYAKPDFIVHQPGEMNYNLVVIEVKSINAIDSGIKKDLKHLTSFVKHAEYHRAIYLIYCEGLYFDRKNRDLFNHIRQYASLLERKCNKSTIDLDMIDLLWHRESGSPAEKWPWQNRD